MSFDYKIRPIITSLQCDVDFGAYFHRFAYPELTLASTRGLSNALQLNTNGNWQHALVTLRLADIPKTNYDGTPMDPPNSFCVGIVHYPGAAEVDLDNVVVSYLSATNANTNKVIAPPISGMTGWWQGNSDAKDIISANGGAVFGLDSYSSGLVDSCFQFDGTNN